MAKKKSRGLRPGGFSLFVLLCGLLIGLPAVQSEWRADSELSRKVDISLQTLKGQDLSLPSGGFSLEILSTNGLQPTARQLDQMLRATGDRTGSFTYTNKAVGIFTMSAQAIDRRQHLVNTYLEGYEPFKVDNVVLPLYLLARHKSYESDRIQYAGREDVWQSSRQAFFYPRGDCEDHAILLADWLISMGEDARVVIGQMAGQGHAWVILFKDGTEYLLEATKKRGISKNKPCPVAALFTKYNPRYMFNRQYFWENAGSTFTTKYSGGQWKKKSRLIYERGSVANTGKINH